MGGRSESGWAAYTYLENASYQYRAKQENRTDAYLADALVAASEMYNRARRPADNAPTPAKTPIDNPVPTGGTKTNE